MPEVGRPKLDQWYLREDTGDKFLVVGYEEDGPTVEIQTADGALDELDQEDWESLSLSLAEAPQDWAAPMDSLDVEDREGVESEPEVDGADAPGGEPLDDMDSEEPPEDDED